MENRQIGVPTKHRQKQSDSQSEFLLGPCRVILLELVETIVQLDHQDLLSVKQTGGLALLVSNWRSIHTATMRQYGGTEIRRFVTESTLLSKPWFQRLPLFRTSGCTTPSLHNFLFCFVCAIESSYCAIIAENEWKLGLAAAGIK